MFKKFFVTFTSLIIAHFAWASTTEGIQIYQKDLRLTPIHLQKLANAINQYRNADNLWDVLRDEFSLQHYENNPAVQAKIEWYMNNQDYLLRSASRAAPYLFYILQQVKKRHLPTELVLLPVVESGYNPFSFSSVGAAGIWQLMPDTASGLGIKQNASYDGRLDIISSTGAALNHLVYLENFFDGNWLLAIAAYNTGEGNVLRAIKRNIRQGRDTDFWSLPVAQETRDYVPSLLALAVIISHPDEYPIYFPPVHNAPYLAQVDVGTQINLKYAASIAGISFKKMQELNPGYKNQSTSTHGPYKLVVPIENVAQFTQNLTHSPLNKPFNWIHYQTKSAETLLAIAKKFHTTTVAIRKLNHLAQNTVSAHTELLIPAPSHIIHYEAETGDNKKIMLAHALQKNLATKLKTDYVLQPGDTIYVARKNDSLKSVAARFHITTKILRVANGFGNNQQLPPGTHLVVPTHLQTVIADAFRRPKKVNTTYMIRKGDTIAKIAKQFNTTPAAIRLTNLIDDDSLVAGEKIIIPAHLHA